MRKCDAVGDIVEHEHDNSIEYSADHTAIVCGASDILVPLPFHSYGPSVAVLIPPGVQGTKK